MLGHINFLLIIPVCKMMNLDSSTKSPRQVLSSDKQSMMAWQVKLCVINKLTVNQLPGSKYKEESRRCKVLASAISDTWFI